VGDIGRLTMLRSLTTLAVTLVLLSAAAVAQETTDRAAPASCWGQATRVFAQMGMMGDHASSFPTPRLGLRNLARALYEQGILPDDTMQALGAFVADELGLSIAACE
jgi:hypothetical protein